MQTKNDNLLNKKAPKFSLLNTNNKTVNNDSIKGKWTVFYFYPKDNTPGCTLEAIDFSSKIEDFKTLNANVIGVSPDIIKTHCAFYDKHNLKITLLSDPDKECAKAFNVLKGKKRKDKTYMGIERSTFIIDPDGIIKAGWRGVKVKGHVDDVLEKLKELQN